MMLSPKEESHLAAVSASLLARHHCRQNEILNDDLVGSLREDLVSKSYPYSVRIPREDGEQALDVVVMLRSDGGATVCGRLFLLKLKRCKAK